MNLRLIKKRVQWAFLRCLGRKEIITETEFGCRIILNFSDVSAGYIYSGRYEREETKLIGKLVKPGMTVMDIGANIGYFTLLMATLVGPKGRVHAFEPNPKVLYRLRRNISANPGLSDGRIVVHPVALGDKHGEADFYCPVEGSEGVGGLKDIKRAPLDNIFRVPVLTLDTLVEENGIGAIDFIKMDIEGGELDVIRGSDQTLKQIKPTILFEAFEMNTAAYGYRVFDILAYLENRSYRVMQAGESFNFLATPRAGK